MLSVFCSLLLSNYLLLLLITLYTVSKTQFENVRLVLHPKPLVRNIG